MSGMALNALLKGIVDQREVPAVTVSGLTVDSRGIRPGMLFVALKGTRKHGLEFADKVQQAGATAIIHEVDAEVTTPEIDIPCIAIDHLRDHLGTIADRFYDAPSSTLNIVGITGTDGKTSVSHFISQALATLDRQCAVLGTLGAGMPGQLQDTGHTTPDVISVHGKLAELKRAGADSVAMEVSSHALDQGRVQAVNFEVAVLTNVTRDHLDYHGTVDAYKAAKARLFDWPGLQAMVLNLDDTFGREIMQRHRQRDMRLIGYGLAEPADTTAECLVARNAEYSGSGMRAEIHFNDERAMLESSVLGEFNLYNLLAMIGALIALGYSLQQAVTSTAHVKTVPGRMERIDGLQDVLLVVDYAHTPDALENALKAMRRHTASRIICVFGCGGDRDRGKRPLMAEVAETHAQMVVLTDDNPRTEMPYQIINDMIAGLKQPEHVAVQHNRREAIRFAIRTAAPGDAILIAGKGHETYQLVGHKRLPFDDRKQAAELIREHAL